MCVRAQVLEQLAESLAPTACTTIEEVGSTGVGALTIAFLILGVSTIVFISRVGSAKGQKIYYYCNVFICGFATMAYFAMLSGQGWTAIAGCRQFFYARYVDWSVTTPLLLLDLGLIAGADGALIAAVIGADRKFRSCSCLRVWLLPMCTSAGSRLRSDPRVSVPSRPSSLLSVLRVRRLERLSVLLLPPPPPQQQQQNGGGNDPVHEGGERGVAGAISGAQ